MKLTLKVYITPHACIRFMERVLEIKAPEDGWLNSDQLRWLRNSITQELEPLWLQISTLGDGQYKVKDFIYVIREGKLRTVKQPESDMVARYSGGVLKSGRKIKKDRPKRSQAKRLRDEKDAKVPKLFLSCTRV